MFYFTTDYKLYHNNLNNLSVQAKHNHHTLPATRGSFTHVQNVKTHTLIEYINIFAEPYMKCTYRLVIQTM